MKFWTNVANTLFSPLSKTESAAPPEQGPSGREQLRRATEPVRDLRPRQMGSMAKKLFANFSSSKGGYRRPSPSQPYTSQSTQQTNPVPGSPPRTDSGYSSQEHLPPFAKPSAPPRQQPPPLPRRPVQYQHQSNLAWPHTPPTPPAFLLDSGYASREDLSSFSPARPQAEAGSAPASPHVQAHAAAGPNVRRQIASFRPDQQLRDVEHMVAQTLERDLAQAKQSGLMLVRDFLTARDECKKAALQDLDNRFQKGMQQLENFPQQQKAERRQKLEADFALARTRLLQTIDQGCRSHGFAYGGAGGNVEWERPLLLKHGLNLSSVTLDKADISAGVFGSVSIFRTDDGSQVIGKISKNNMRNGAGKVIDDLGVELEAYQRVYQKVGPHPNLVNAYGIGRVQKNGKTERAMLMEYVPGSDGDEAFQALRNCWQSGKISSSQYWGAMQFMARRLLDVSNHINEAGIAHRDIKPANLRINEESGEPILIDLGVAAKHGTRHAAGTPRYVAPEQFRGADVDRNIDTYAAGATMVDATRRGDARIITNRDGTARKLIPSTPKSLLKGDVQNHDGSWTRKLDDTIRTDHTRFFDATMALERKKRFDMGKAKKDLAILDTHEMSPEAALEVIKNAQVPAFLSDSLLEDDAAKEVIKNAMKMAKEESAKPADQRWKTTQKQEAISPEREKETKALLADLLNKPDLATLGTLQNYSKTDRDLKAHLGDGRLIAAARPSLERQADSFATGLLAETGWFGSVESAVRAIKTHATPSNAAVPAHEKQEHEKQLSREAGRLRREVGSLVPPEYLRQYADQAEAFLRNVDGLPGGVHNPRVAEKVEQVRQRAVAAREVVKLLDAAPPESGRSVRDLSQRIENPGKPTAASQEVKKQPGQTTELLSRMRQAPDLATYATLHAQASQDANLKAELDKTLTPAAISTMHRDTHGFISGLLAVAPWFDAMDTIAKKLPPPALRVGGANNLQLARARAELGTLTTPGELREYQQQLAMLLRNCDVLPGAKPPVLEAGIAQLHRRAAVLADVLNLMDARS